ncbi:hypothetical protein Tco_1338800 [Tanacetum coccineum]
MVELRCKRFRGDSLRGMQAVVQGVMLQELIKIGELIQQARQRLFVATTIKKKATWQDSVPNQKGQEILHATFQTDDLDAFDSDCDEAPSASVVLMAKLSSYDSDVLSEVPTHDNYLDNHVNEQGMHEMQYSEQQPFNNETDVDITSDSNIISNEQYLKETKNLVVQNTNSSAQQDALIMYVIEEMYNQVAKYSKETLILAEESRLKMHDKQNDPIAKEKKVNIAHVDYAALNKQSEHFVPHKNFSSKQAFWLPISQLVSETPPVKPEPILKEIPRKLLTISLVKDSFIKGRSHVNDFDKVITVRTKVTGLGKEITDMKKVFKQMETEVGNCSVERKHFEIKEQELLLENDQLLELLISQDLVHTAVNSLAEIVDYQSMEKSYLDEYSKCVQLKAELLKNNDMVEKAVYNELSKRCARIENRSQLQAKDNSINKLKDHIATLKGKSVSECDTSKNIPKVIAPGMYKLDLEPLSPKLLQNKEAHVDYLKHTKEHADTLHEIVE